MDKFYSREIMNAISEFERNIRFYYSYYLDKAIVPPDTVQISLTYSCNLRCKMCNIRNLKVDFEITSGDVMRLIDEAVEWGVPEVLFLGGEPFLHKDIIRFVMYAGNKGLSTTIVTNGTLIDERLAEIIVDSPLTQLVISLDGATEKTHDWLREMKGVYKKVINAIEMVDKYKKRKQKNRFDPPLIIIPTTLMNANLNEMWSYVVLGNKLPVSAVGFQPVLIDNTNLCFSDINSPMWIPKSRLKVMDKMINKIIKYKKQRKNFQPVIGNSFLHLESIKKYFRGNLSQEEIKCYIGYTRVVISPDGDTSLCGRGIGNINHQSMKDIWNSELAMKERFRIRNCTRPCLQFCTIRPESELGTAFDTFIKRIDLAHNNHQLVNSITEYLLDKFSTMGNMLKESIKEKSILNKLVMEIGGLKREARKLKIKYSVPHF